MKKRVLIFIALSLSILFLSCGNKNEKHRYSSIGLGPDTIESFGDDGQFGIFKFADEGKKCLDLYDVKNMQSIDVVSKYKEINPVVYSVGKKGYTKINYENKSVIQSDILDSFSDLDKKIFNELKH